MHRTKRIQNQAEIERDRLRAGKPNAPEQAANGECLPWIPPSQSGSYQPRETTVVLRHVSMRKVKCIRYRPDTKGSVLAALMTDRNLRFHKVDACNKLSSIKGCLAGYRGN